MRYFDAHAHIQFPEFAADRIELLSSLEERGIGALIVGVDRKSSEEAITLADSSKDRYAAVGLHPNYVTEEVFDMDAYTALAQSKSVVAIGECGLDNYRPLDVGSAKSLQQEIFMKHVELAARVRKPLMIHARPAKGTQDAYQELITLLTKAKQMHGDALTGNVHFFVGGIPEATALIDLGFTLSFTAVLTFTKDYDAVIAHIPLTSILTETDSPYAAPPPGRGTRNDPRSVERVVARIAEIKELPEEAVREQVLANARRVFGLS